MKAMFEAKGCHVESNPKHLEAKHRPCDEKEHQFASEKATRRHCSELKGRRIGFTCSHEGRRPDFLLKHVAEAKWNACGMTRGRARMKNTQQSLLSDTNTLMISE